MSEQEAQRRTYPHGVPCWVDTEQHDPQAASRFYGSLFGWTFEDATPPDAPGTYLIATLGGQDVAAISSAGDGVPGWNTYVAVDDADTTAAAVQAAGGTVPAPPQDAGPGGRSARCADPSGVEFRLWQPRRRLGAQVANAPGAWNFSDLHTDDPAAATEFYAAVFGWRADRVGSGDWAAIMLRVPRYGEHLASTVDPSILERQEGVGAPPGFADAIGWLAGTDNGEQPHWHVTFTVADRDESIDVAQRLGATVVSSADTEWTRAALLRDPEGAEFTVSQFAPPG